MIREKKEPRPLFWLDPALNVDKAPAQSLIKVPGALLEVEQEVDSRSSKHLEQGAGVASVPVIPKVKASLEIFVGKVQMFLGSNRKSRCSWDQIHRWDLLSKGNGRSPSASFRPSLGLDSQ